MSDETQTAITGPKEGDPISGQLWRHHSGRVYRVERVTNTAHLSEKFPPMVVYVNVYNGTEWSRPLSDWHRSFTFVGSAPIRAAGTEGGATDGTGTRAVDWPGESEITRLRAENERLTKERDEARAWSLALKMVKEEIAGCFNAAFVEGWVDALANDEADRLRDIWERRLMHAYNAALSDFSHPHPNPATAADADRAARDVAAVKAGIEAAANSLEGDPLGFDGFYGAIIRAIDPEAVLKAMEEGR